MVEYNNQSRYNTDKLFPKPPNWNAILDCATGFRQSGSDSGEEGQMDAQNEENVRKDFLAVVPAVVCGLRKMDEKERSKGLARNRGSEM